LALCGCEGICNFATCVGSERQGQKNRALGFTGFAALGLCGKRSISSDLIFLLLFVSRQKVMGHHGQEWGKPGA
jgi:hypothetical protein